MIWAAPKCRPRVLILKEGGRRIRIREADMMAEVGVRGRLEGAGLGREARMQAPLEDKGVEPCPPSLQREPALPTP